MPFESVFVSNFKSLKFENGVKMKERRFENAFSVIAWFNLQADGG